MAKHDTTSHDGPTLDGVPVTTPIQARQFIKVAAVFVLLGVLLLGACAWLTVDRIRFLEQAEETTATVVDRESSWSSVSSTTGSGSRTRRERVYRPTFQFTDLEGVEHTVRMPTASSEWKWAKGSKVRVRYLPDNPYDVRPRMGLLNDWLWPLVTGGLGVAFLVVAIVGGVKAGRIANA